MELEFKVVKLDIPEGTNIIIGQSHFIKTVEDLYEIMISTVPNARFGIAFCEASGFCLVRSDGNDPKLTQMAEENAINISAGHSFNILIRECFPINVLNAIKMCQEICSIYCATANPVEVIIAETNQGRGIMGVIDGSSPKGIESQKDKQDRYELLRKFNYKK